MSRRLRAISALAELARDAADAVRSLVALNVNGRPIIKGQNIADVAKNTQRSAELIGKWAQQTDAEWEAENPVVH
jgi:hypothetical protein